MKDKKGTAYTDNVSIGDDFHKMSPETVNKFANSGLMKYGKGTSQLEDQALKELLRLRKKGIDPSKH